MRESSKKKKNVVNRRKEPDLSTYSGRFAARLRSLRDKTGMSADEFAEMHGFNRATYYGWEVGKSAPHYDLLPELAKAFGIPVRTLIPKE